MGGASRRGEVSSSGPKASLQCAGPYLGVASAPRGSSWGGRWSRGLLDVSARGSGFPVRRGGFCSREGLCWGRGIPSSTSLVGGLGGVLCRVVVLHVCSDG